MIRVSGLTVQVPGFTLHPAAFTVPAGGVGIVTGPTGSGKSTLLEAIAGVRPVSGGAVECHGVDVTRQPPESRGVGLVYQAALLFPHLDVSANLAYGATDLALVDELRGMLPLRPLEARPVATLSGGERQLVALARAMAAAPRVLLLDEPFAAMDGALRDAVRAAVLAWASGRQVTTLLVTHDPAETVLDAAVRLRLESGRVTMG
ncbi:MAG: ATP-binding cassette domain-containing protein [Gemmatimonadaceae bacterium]|nr:ATP-binding cassette domain-containing protein [Gemmatimonadaceae bacterium]